MGLTGISFSFVVSPVLINLGYQLVDRFKTETKPDLPLKALSKSIHDHVVVVGYSYVGRVICMMLERANIPFIAFERRLDRIAEAKKEKRKVYFGDVTSPGMMNALAISRARAVIVTTRDYSAAKQLISTVLHFHPNLKVMTAVRLSVSARRVAGDWSSAGGRSDAGGHVELWQIGLGRAWHQTR